MAPTVLCHEEFGLIGRLVLQRYEVQERVGEGPLFQTFRARDRQSGRMVAVKSPHGVALRDAAFCTGLVQSAEALLGLTHPSIVRVLEVGRAEGAPVLVSEFVRGIDLKERIRRIAPFTLSVATDFAVAIAEALQHAHSEGIVHGDVRPHNVIVSPDGAVKVTDFGVARAMTVSGPVAATNLPRSIHYQAPEVAAGAPLNAISDVYALGVVLFEMLTGGVPFSGDNPVQVATKHQSSPTPSPRSLNPGVPRSLEGIVLMALQKSPEARYQSVSEMLSDLKTVRDALRFGKSLSWSPLDNVRAPAPAPVIASTAARPTETPALEASERGAVRTTPAARPVPERAAGAGKEPEVRDRDRISGWLKFAIGTVLAVIIVTVIVGAALWMATVNKPVDQKFPELVGKPLEAARALADKVNVRLIVRDEPNEKVDSGIVFKTDYETGRTVRPGHSVIVWVSKGSRMVWIPNIVGKGVDDAGKLLADAGLVLGSATPQRTSTGPDRSVLSQNPRSGKRVDRGTQVNLVFSELDPSADPGPPVDPSAGESPGAQGAAADTEARTTTLRIPIREDGKGTRRVRVEYEDAHGVSTAVDEDHSVGDSIVQRVDVYGPQLTVRVYYDDVLVSQRTERLARPQP